MNAIQSETGNDDWQQIRPLLDEALGRLNKTDRDALLLRFFEQQSLAQVGASLGGSEDAARKRVNRALEKLREILVRRGVTTTAAALSTVISANAIQVAPAGLAATLTTSSIAIAGTGTTFTFLKIMTATKLKLALSAIIVASAATAFVVQHQTQTKLRAQNESLAQQIAQLQTDNESLSNRLTAVGDSQKLTDEQFNELLRLRGEVGVLRRQTNQLENLHEALANSKLSTQSSEENVSPQEQQRRMVEYKMADAQQSCLGLIMYAGDNHGHFPTNFDQVARYITSTNQFQALSNEFGIVYQGSQTNIADPSATIVIQENQAWQTYDGKWAKVYGFADGHSEVQVKPYNNFASFEQQHTVPPPANGQ
jgi:cell division protein FtsL